MYRRHFVVAIEEIIVKYTPLRYRCICNYSASSAATNAIMAFSAVHEEAALLHIFRRLRYEVGCEYPASSVKSCCKDQCCGAGSVTCSDYS
jgi:hypothetical protein